MRSKIKAVHKSKILDEFFAPDFKTLVRKDNGEYAMYIDGMMFTGEMPILLGKTTTIAKLRKYHLNSLEYKEKVIFWNDYKIIGITVVKHLLK